MAGQSRCSKAASVEMGDLSEAQALQYLEKRGVALKAAAAVVHVTGGRLLQLMSAVEVLQHGGTPEGEARAVRPRRGALLLRC